MNFATTLFQNIQTTILNVQNRTARRQAVRSALMSVTNTHSDYKGIGFDEHFMANGAAELMNLFVNNGQLPTPGMLTTTWAAQYPFSGAAAQRAIANITPMVTEFVNVLASETSSLPTVQQPASATAGLNYVAASQLNIGVLQEFRG